MNVNLPIKLVNKIYLLFSTVFIEVTMVSNFHSVQSALARVLMKTVGSGNL